MTLANNYNPTRQLANGVTTSFSFTYDMINSNYATVYQEIDDVQTIVDSSLYTVEFDTNGGNVIFKTAPAAGMYIVIGRDVPLDQTVPYRTSSGFPANRIEENLDKLTGATQQLSNESNRSPKIPIGLQNINMNLPFPSSGKALVWNQSGNALINSSINIDETIEDVTEQANIATQKANEAAASANQASTSASAADLWAQSAKDSVEQAQEIVSEFDVNATEKTQAFNSNAAEKQARVDAAAETARQWAVGTIEEQPAGSSEYWAGEAKTAAENADNGYELFQASWFDHKPEAVSWLRADTFSWQDGDVYFAAYNELFAQYGAETSVEETNTVGSVSVTCKRTPKGYKICAPDQADNIAALYENTGVAWYYILDTENKRFKLPRTKWSFVGCRDNAGNYVPETLPNIKGGFYSNALLEGSSGAFYDGNNPWGSTSNSSSKNNQMNFNASRSSSTYQDGAAVQQRAVEMFLYFFAGNAVKSDTIIDTGQITEALNAKLDLDAVNLSQSGKSLLCGLGKPSGRYIDLQLGASGSTYTAPANGWAAWGGQFSTAAGNFSIGNGSFYSQGTAVSGAQYLGVYIPVKKGEKFYVDYGAVSKTVLFRFIYDEGENE